MCNYEIEEIGCFGKKCFNFFQYKSQYFQKPSIYPFQIQGIIHTILLENNTKGIGVNSYQLDIYGPSSPGTHFEFLLDQALNFFFQTHYTNTRYYFS